MISQIQLLNQFDRSFTDEELFQLLRYFRSAVKPMSGYTPEEIRLLNVSKARVCAILNLFFRAVPSGESRRKLPYSAIFQLADYVLFGRVRILAAGDTKAVIAGIPRLKEIVARFQKKCPVLFPRKAENQPLCPAVHHLPSPRPVAVRYKSAGDCKREAKERWKARAAAIPSLPNDGLTVYHGKLGYVSVTPHAWKRFIQRYCQLAKISKIVGWYDPEHFVKKIKEIFARSEEVQISSEGVVGRLINNEYIPVRYFLDKALNLRFVVKEAGIEKPVLLTVEIAYRK